MMLYKTVITPDGQEDVPFTDDEIEHRRAEEAAFEAEEANNAIIRQIIALEETQTPRRVREGGQWMVDLNAKISALRAQLT